VPFVSISTPRTHYAICFIGPAGSALFTETERAVLEVVEEITLIFQHGVSDHAYEKLQSHFTTKEIADIMICICHMNFLNRVGISTKTIAI
jgi:alkylhydroperoxidase family enzyme